MSPLDLLSVRDISVWLLVIGATGFAAMGVDKAMARSNRGERISEKTLWLTALAGGFAGIIIGGLAFHHKTSKGTFWPPVILSVVLWTAFLWLVFRGSV
jgi:uncharacterized membrane protein YsdA (DUF1294 family)